MIQRERSLQALMDQAVLLGEVKAEVDALRVTNLESLSLLVLAAAAPASTAPPTSSILFVLVVSLVLEAEEGIR